VKDLVGPEAISLHHHTLCAAMSLLTGGGVFSLCSRCTRTLSRLALTPQHQITRHYQWKKQTHYDILGIHPEATQSEIKAAYLKLSKELHPDKNLRSDKFDRELIHSQYVKVVEAYSVLGKEKERRMYDLQTGIKTDPEQFQSGEAGDGKQRKGWRPMNFEERVKAYGFPEQDPDFYKKRGNYHKKVVIACIAWIIFGFCISFITIRAFYGLHSRELELQNQINSNSLAESRANAKTYGSIEMQREMLFKKWTDDRKKRDSEFDE